MNRQRQRKKDNREQERVRECYELEGPGMQSEQTERKGSVYHAGIRSGSMEWSDHLGKKTGSRNAENTGGR